MRYIVKDGVVITLETDEELRKKIEEIKDEQDDKQDDSWE